MKQPRRVIWECPDCSRLYGSEGYCPKCSGFEFEDVPEHWAPPPAVKLVSWEASPDE